jgi:hypothetical protein
MTTHIPEFIQGREARSRDRIGMICISPYPEGSGQDKAWIAGWEYENDEIWFEEYGVNEWHTLNKAAHYSRITRGQLHDYITKGEFNVINIGQWKYRMHGSDIKKIRNSRGRDASKPCPCGRCVNDA